MEALTLVDDGDEFTAQVLLDSGWASGPGTGDIESGQLVFHKAIGDVADVEGVGSTLSRPIRILSPHTSVSILGHKLETNLVAGPGLHDIAAAFGEIASPESPTPIVVASTTAPTEHTAPPAQESAEPAQQHKPAATTPDTPSAAPAPPERAPNNGGDDELSLAMLHALTRTDRTDVAKAYFDRRARDNAAESKRQTWEDAADRILLARLLSDTDHAVDNRTLMVDLFRKKAGLPSQTEADTAADLRWTKVYTETQRADLLKNTVDMAAEIKRQTQIWSRLAWAGTAILVISLLIGFVVIFGALTALKQGQVDGWEFVGIVFVIALFALSPAVLLILQRPLKGLDTWSPAGNTDPNDSADSKNEKKPSATRKDDANA